MPRYRQKVVLGAGPARQPGLGRRPRLRRRLSRAPVRPAQAGHRRAAARILRADPVAAARPAPPAVGDVPDRGTGRRTGRDRDQDPLRDRRRHRRDRPRAGAPRSGPDSRSVRRAAVWMPRPAPEPRPNWCSTRSARSSGARPRRSTSSGSRCATCAARPDGRCATAGGLLLGAAGRDDAAPVVAAAGAAGERRRFATVRTDLATLARSTPIRT